MDNTSHLDYFNHVQVGGASQSPGGATAPAPFSHTLSNVTRLTDTSHRSPLTKTNFADTFRPYVPEPQSLAAAERQEFLDEKRREKQAIVHQAYRTLPLIAPKAKTKHDLPTGSYLRHVHDPNWKTTQSGGGTAVTNFAVMNKMREAVGAMPNSPGFTIMNVDTATTVDGPQLFHRQYNSPINLYSPQNVAETLHGQTGLQPSRPSPAAPGRRIHNAADITLSPTFQMIHNEEWTKDLKSSQLKEHKPVQNRLYVPNVSSDGTVNALGVPKGKILQSRIFNTLLTSLVLGSSEH